MAFSDGTCSQCEYLVTIDESDEVLDEDEDSKGGDKED